MKIFIALLAFCALAFAAQPFVLNYNDEFEFRNLYSLHKEKHGLSFEQVEDSLRYGIFVDNLRFIHEHNLSYMNGTFSFHLGPTQFAHMTNSEYRESLNYQYNFNRDHSGDQTADVAVPDTQDWRKKGAVNPVQQQGSCGACWAFSAMASMEGEYFIRTNKLMKFSEQECVDCVNGGAQTCKKGGEPNTCITLAEKKGACTEKGYPYEGTSGNQCRIENPVQLPFTSFFQVPSGDEKALKTASAGHVVSVGINASSMWFQFYYGGVYDHKHCSGKPTDLDHGVAVVGYGNEDGKDYWIVRNSWDSSWGEHGYIKMRRNRYNQCGIATDAVYPN